MELSITTANGRSTGCASKAYHRAQGCQTISYFVAAQSLTSNLQKLCFMPLPHVSALLIQTRRNAFTGPLLGSVARGNRCRSSGNHSRPTGAKSAPHLLLRFGRIACGGVNAKGG